MPALARRCRNKSAAHKYSVQGFPGRFKEMIQLVPRGSFSASRLSLLLTVTETAPAPLAQRASPRGRGRGCVAW